jgi:hypothetical protein
MRDTERRERGKVKATALVVRYLSFATPKATRRLAFPAFSMFSMAFTIN